MTVEIAMWIFGSTAVPTLGWVFWISLVLRQTKVDTEHLVEMHESPDDYGFGTIATNEAQKENTRAVEDLTHYIKWFVEHATGEKPPPRI